ncbi:MAG: metallophosphoesterase [Clostridia bacterium]|nr:metallophosphoesterase [Clostridia bacterium]MDD4386676.1 metallophosphoesterase [Clostridia bacterium]
MTIIIIIICICVFTIYVILDNNDVNIKYSDVYIENLPDEFNNYTILQMTDLHSKEFGFVLYNKINSINYDAIVFTGDMINNKDYNMKSFKNLLSNINNRNLIIYVDGNNGPKTYDEEKNKVTNFGLQVESLGCTLLKDTYCIEKNDFKIWLSNFDIATNMFVFGKKYYYEEKFKQKFSLIGNNISIAIGHKPVGKTILNCISMNKIKYYKYDLIIAGHYHGGQIKIPFLRCIICASENI